MSDNYVRDEEVTRDYTAERDEKCRPVVLELVHELFEVRKDTLYFGSTKPKGGELLEKDVAEHYQKLCEEIFDKVFYGKNLKVVEIDYIIKTAMQPFGLLKQVVDLTIAYKQEIARARKWGLEDERDLMLDDMQDYLVEEGKKAKAKKAAEKKGKTAVAKKK